MRPLTDAEIQRVMAQLKPRDRCFFVLGLRTGFRVSELLSLRLGDVWQAGAVPEIVAVARKAMKGKTEGRTVDLHPQARAELASWAASLEARGADEKAPLFPSQKGGAAITRMQAWALLTNAYKRAGISGRGIGVHGLRKTFAGRMYNILGHDLIETKKAMGHKSVSSTEAYLSFADSKVKAAMTAPDGPNNSV